MDCLEQRQRAARATLAEHRAITRSGTARAWNSLPGRARQSEPHLTVDLAPGRNVDDAREAGGGDQISKRDHAPSARASTRPMTPGNRCTRAARIVRRITRD